MKFRVPLLIFLTSFILFVAFFILSRSLWTLFFFLPFILSFFIKGGKQNDA